MAGRNRTIDHEAVKALAAQKVSYSEIARRLGGHPNYLRLIVTGQVGGDTAISRKASKPLQGRQSTPMPAYDHPALVESRTLYPSTLVSATVSPHSALKSGMNSAKIGKRIQKGKWKGFEVYTLTLQERATCPTSCTHWRSCFGNGMPQADRFEHGPALEARLIREVAHLSERHPAGFAVRLHVLGDFYSVEYVKIWGMMLEQFPPLHAFGFSARWDGRTDPIARALVGLVMKHWDRFAIRFSDAPVDECSTVSIEHPVQAPSDAVVCPQQLGKTAACSTCALCWQSKRRIAFITH